MAENKPRVIFVLGPPGVGKGTMCIQAAQDFPTIVHLSAGELLRKSRELGSEHGQIIESNIKQGKIVPAEITIELLKTAMIENGWNVYVI